MSNYGIDDHTISLEHLTQLEHTDQEADPPLTPKQQEIQRRVRELYLKQLSGWTPRQCVYWAMDTWNVSERQSWRYMDTVSDLIRTDWEDQKPALVQRLQQIRLAIVEKAIKRNQFQVAVTALKDLGAVLGEAEQTAQATLPQLNIVLETRNTPQIQGDGTPTLELQATPEILHSSETES